MRHPFKITLGGIPQPLPHVVMAVLLPALAAGCSRRIEEEDPPIRFERRTEACTGWCEVKMHPECGADTSFPNFDACVDHCTSEESLNWGLQPDGIDACFDEQVEFFGCFDSLSCDDRHRWFQNQREVHPCNHALDILIECI